MGEAKRRQLPKLAPWTKWERGYLPPLTESEIRDRAEAFGVSIDVLREQLAITLLDEVWVNSRYQVNIRRRETEDSGGLIIWLSIKRLDKQPPGPERFRDFQRIKNELVGPEHEAVEIYPAESQLVDTSNQFHLWVFADPDFRLPFGLRPTGRTVMTHSAGGAVQQPFEEDE